MTVKQPHAAPSLLPVLMDRGSGIRLKLQSTGDNGPDGHHSSTIEGAGPFTRILKGYLTSDGDSAFTRLFMLVQPDDYPVTPSELKPVSNIDVDRLWQSSWEHLKGTADGDLSPVLPGQIDEKGQLIPFRPLFHCRHKDRFAHPLCPDCGEPLSLCLDDAHLAAAGLPGYGKSLDRYLYCRNCHASRQAAVFYAHGGSVTPGSDVKDCARLIEGFSALLAKAELAADLPCVACDQATECYGPSTLVHQRMHPVFFYPFYMLMQPAASLNAVEFLHQISGATFDQMARHLVQHKKPGRLGHLEAMRDSLFQGSGRLFEDERRFLEVLYLKLVFLEELSALVLQPEGPFAATSADMPLESLWVRLPRDTNRLPLFWNFALQHVDPVGRPPQTVLKTGVPMARAWQFLGTAWCYTFLVNAQQDMATVLAAVDKLLLGTEEITRIGKDSLREIDPVFAPHHLLWQSSPFAMDPRWEDVWCRALLLGLDVLQAGLKSDAHWPADRFKQQLHDTLAKIHTLIFQAPAGITATAAPDPEPVEVTAAPASADLKIAGLLQTILDKWPAADAKPANGTTIAPQENQIPVKADAHPNEDGDFEETIILESPPARVQVSPDTHATPPDLEKTVVMGTPTTEQPTAPWPREDDQATLIIPPKQPPEPTPLRHQPARNEDVSPAGQPAEPDLEATVALGAPGQPRGVPSRPSDDMAATMIITPGLAPDSPEQAAPPISKVETRPSSLLDALEETVIQGSRPPSAPVPPPRKAPPPAGEPPAGESDDLEKTVILSPEKGKGRTPQK